MHFYTPAEKQPCYYCKRFASFEKDYPIREGVFTLEDYVYRCAWHARFKCSHCGEEYHFSWFYWCPTKQELVCGTCNPPSLRPVAFWDRTYAYAFGCEHCDDVHYDILYSEFKGVHPWQCNSSKPESVIEIDEQSVPMWTPLTVRSGNDISLVQALKLENRVIELRRELDLFTPIRSAVPVDEVDSKDQRDRWEINSEVWIKNYEEGDLNRRFIIDPALWKVLGDVKGLKVLDAGCGNGYLARELARKGAEVVGVDYSKSFIEFCRSKNSELGLNCTFIHASLTDLSELAESAFDIVVSNVVICDIVDYRLAFKEIHRVLKDDGRFVWSNTHPVFGNMGAIDIRFPKDSMRNEERYLKMIDRYFDSGGTLVDWLTTPVWQFHRTLGEYSTALKEAGFVILEIIEPRPTYELIQQYPRYLAFDADRWTHFIIFECAKR